MEFTNKVFDEVVGSDSWNVAEFTGLNAMAQSLVYGSDIVDPHTRELAVSMLVVRLALAKAKGLGL